MNTGDKLEACEIEIARLLQENNDLNNKFEYFKQSMDETLIATDALNEDYKELLRTIIEKDKEIDDLKLKVIAFNFSKVAVSDTEVTVSETEYNLRLLNLKLKDENEQLRSDVEHFKQQFYLAVKENGNYNLNLKLTSKTKSLSEQNRYLCERNKHLENLKVKPFEYIDDLVSRLENLAEEIVFEKTSVIKAYDQYIKLYNFVSDRDEELIKEFIEEYCKNEDDPTEIYDTDS